MQGSECPSGFFAPLRMTEVAGTPRFGVRTKMLELRVSKRNDNPSMQPPPLLPEKILARVERVGRLHGGGVLYVAGVFALLSGMGGDTLGAIVGLAVAGAGAMEHHGATILGQGAARGLRWLIGSQVCLFASIAVYCAVRLAHLELPPIPEQLRPMLEINAAQVGLSVDDFVAMAYRLTLKLVLGLSIFYQGGLALYYYSKRHALTSLLGGE